VYFLKLEFDEGKQAVLVVEGKTWHFSVWKLKESSSTQKSGRDGSSLWRKYLWYHEVISDQKDTYSKKKLMFEPLFLSQCKIRES
jgi:hypothetical protein